jgi:hypothetical protein
MLASLKSIYKKKEMASKYQYTREKDTSDNNNENNLLKAN